ncbi:MAG: MotA/TolQ/ExbB proton channel family protein [Hahellaceae bacterium]|nr:MotA/TolQ/ExbB proton channel family protein [Hahellaceae bacterium]MCP5170429.1 MotA/TolQ/ExbB proton channel family protein [Hahellaceae bacterium]
MSLTLPVPIAHLLQQGGSLLWVILGVALLIFILSAERFIYLVATFPPWLRQLQQQWGPRAGYPNWQLMRVRDALQAQGNEQLQDSLWLLKTCIVVCPLLGLTGTVTGMILVFENLSFVGTANPRLMSAGIFQATIPTMAGMLVAIVGMLLQNMILRLIKKRQHELGQALADQVQAVDASSAGGL